MSEKFGSKAVDENEDGLSVLESCAYGKYQTSSFV